MLTTEKLFHTAVQQWRT